MMNKSTMKATEATKATAVTTITTPTYDPVKAAAKPAATSIEWTEAQNVKNHGDFDRASDITPNDVTPNHVTLNHVTTGDVTHHNLDSLFQTTCFATHLISCCI